MPAHISSWSDLQKYGINRLTGEACAYSMRGLCDLNEDGVSLLREVFGMQITLATPAAQFNANWNSTVNGKPAVASVMLFNEMLPLLAKFVLFDIERCTYIVCVGDGSCVGYTADDIAEYMLTRSKLTQLYGGKLYTNPRNTEASVGSRNVHQATGRIN